MTFGRVVRFQTIPTRRQHRPRNPGRHDIDLIPNHVAKPLALASDGAQGAFVDTKTLVDIVDIDGGANAVALHVLSNQRLNMGRQFGFFGHGLNPRVKGFSQFDNQSILIALTHLSILDQGMSSPLSRDSALRFHRKNLTPLGIDWIAVLTSAQYVVVVQSPNAQQATFFALIYDQEAIANAQMIPRSLIGSPDIESPIQVHSLSIPLLRGGLAGRVFSPSALLPPFRFQFLISPVELVLFGQEPCPCLIGLSPAPARVGALALRISPVPSPAALLAPTPAGHLRWG